MSKPLLEWIYQQQWAMTPEALRAMMDIVENHAHMDQLQLAYENNFKSFHAVEQTEFKALQAIRGDALAGASTATLRGNVALIPVLGPIIPRASLLSLSGAASVTTMARDLQVALESKAVEAIVFHADTPGGQIPGVAELSDMILEGRERKPIYTYVSGQLASAGYWFGSAATEVVGPETALFGSIGVVGAVTKTDEADAKKGIKTIEVVSSTSPKKRLDPETAEGRTEIQKRVDGLADLFIGAVARNRGTDADDVIENFGQGGMLLASEAIEAGMADRIISLEGLIDELNSSNSSFSGGFTMDVKTLKAEHEEVYNAVFQAGVESVQAGVDEAALKAARTEGATAERERIQGIETLKAPGHEALIAEMKYNAEATRETVAAAVLDAKAQKEEKAGEDVEADAAEAAEAVEDVAADSAPSAQDKMSDEATEAAELMAKAASKRNGREKA